MVQECWVIFLKHCLDKNVEISRSSPGCPWMALQCVGSSGPHSQRTSESQGCPVICVMSKQMSYLTLSVCFLGSEKSSCGKINRTLNSKHLDVVLPSYESIRTNEVRVPRQEQCFFFESDVSVVLETFEHGTMIQTSFAFVVAEVFLKLSKSTTMPRFPCAPHLLITIR